MITAAKGLAALPNPDKVTPFYKQNENKRDKIKKSELQKQLKDLKDKFDLVAVPFTIKKDSGKENLLIMLDEALKE